MNGWGKDAVVADSLSGIIASFRKINPYYGGTEKTKACTAEDAENAEKNLPQICADDR